MIESFNYCNTQDKELRLDEFHYSDRSFYKFRAVDIYRNKKRLDIMMRSMGIEKGTNYTMFLYYFRKHTVRVILSEIAANIINAVEFVSFESTFDEEITTVTSNQKYFYLYTRYGKFRISKENTMCENLLLLEPQDWKYLMNTGYFGDRLKEKAQEFMP